MTSPIPADPGPLLPTEFAAPVARFRDAAEEMGLTLYLVGGPVRDWLLGRSVVDVDLLVAGGDEKSAAKLARKVLGRNVKVREHPRFFTLTVDLGTQSIDLATLRKETYDHPGALPKVVPGSLEDDLLRRDFSVNALAVALRGGGGEDISSVIDLADGIRDLGEKTLRVLHPRSFHDDPTRALRAARLSSRLGFQISRSSRSYLRDALRDGVFGGLSGDRLRREFEKLFAEASLGGHPVTAVERLDKWHVLAALEPGLGLHANAKAPLRRLGKLFANPPWRPREHRPWVSGLCIWLAPLSPNLRRRTVARLSVRGDVGNRIVDFAKSSARWIKALEGTRGRGAVDLVLGDLDEEQLFALCACCSSLLRRRVVRWAAEDRDRRIPVSGRDLVNADLEGEVVGVALARIRAAYLDGEVANREEAMALAREIQRRNSVKRRTSRPRKRGSVGREPGS